MIGIDASDAVMISAKTGLGVPDVLEALVTRLPSPTGDATAPLEVLLVDSWYDAYLGVMILVRVKEGTLKRGQKVRFMNAKVTHTIDRVGVFTPKPIALEEMGPGEVGFINCGMKTVAECEVGDTITEDKRPCAKPLAGFKPSIPVVFLSLIHI